MHKVLVERPRWNPGPDKSGRRANLPDELLPKFEGIKRPHSSRKGLTDLLGPLKRWLHSRVGRPWDDVYREACAVIRPDNVVRAHIKTHLLEFVQRHTFMKGAEIWCFNGRWSTEEMPLVTATGFVAPFYVHPVTRLLCATPSRPRHRWRDRKAERRAATQHWLDETTLIRQLNGCWFKCQVGEFPKCFAKGESPWRFDLAEKKPICRSNAREIYGREVHCVAKRQLSRRELRKLSLANVSSVSAGAHSSEFDCPPCPDDCAPARNCGATYHWKSSQKFSAILFAREANGPGANPGFLTNFRI